MAKNYIGLEIGNGITTMYQGGKRAKSSFRVCLRISWMAVRLFRRSSSHSFEKMKKEEGSAAEPVP